ncbi:hypothetical protein QYM36_014492 [Artemia franciscana]|uniref:HECT domain-containing protein n=1 Tax=Artemia franciscana TaxID=6661 RepID=A0AA88HBC9_ARTSF|nr:hypothetical protein QYM36_014492 [Artemia franciscana]
MSFLGEGPLRTKAPVGGCVSEAKYKFQDCHLSYETFLITVKPVRGDKSLILEQMKDTSLRNEAQLPVKKEANLTGSTLKWILFWSKAWQFVIDSSKMHLQGFATLEGVNILHEFHIHSDDMATDHLLIPRTCSNQLALPSYVTYDKLKEATGSYSGMV